MLLYAVSYILHADEKRFVKFIGSPVLIFTI